MNSIAISVRWVLPMVLLTLCALLVANGCNRGAKKPPVPGEEWADDLRSRIDRHIQNPEKKSQLLDLVAKDTDIFKALSREILRYNQELFTVDKNYHSTPDDFRAVFSAFNETRYRLRAKSIGVRFKMKALCSSEEWQALSHFRSKKGLFHQLQQTPGIE